MKRLTILFAALVLLTLGCNRQNTPKVTPLPEDIADYDMVMLDEGQLSFYNSETAVMTPLAAEKDSVVNVAFTSDVLYYSVAKDGKILLRCIDLTQPNPQPKQLADWGVPYEKCLTETYGDVSPLEYYRGRHTLGLYHNFSWDGYWFIDQKLYDMETGKITDWTWEWEIDNINIPEEEEEQTEENYHYVSTADELQEYLVQDEGQYYMTDGNDDNYVCLTDKIDYTKYLSNPEYAEDVEFEYISSSPDNSKVLYMIILEWGDYPHGVLAVSSIDGKFQMPLEDTDCTGYTAEWLDDGSLVYVGERNSIKRIYPDGQMKIIAHSNDFQVKQSVLNK